MKRRLFLTCFLSPISFSTTTDSPTSPACECTNEHERAKSVPQLTCTFLLLVSDFVRALFCLDLLLFSRHRLTNIVRIPFCGPLRVDETILESMSYCCFTFFPPHVGQRTILQGGFKPRVDAFLVGGGGLRIVDRGCSLVNLLCFLSFSSPRCSPAYSPTRLVLCPV